MDPPAPSPYPESPLPLPHAATQGRYRPRAATNALKEIVADAFEDLFSCWDERFRNDYGPLHPRVRDLLESFLRCGDLHFGFVRLRCVNPDCAKKDSKIFPFFCRSYYTSFVQVEA